VLIPSGFVYLFLYFNAQLKVMSDHRPAYWKMILTIAPLLGASLIAASLTVDEYHNWVSLSQVPARSGWPVWLMTVRLRRAITGTLCAFVAFRKTFAATWDFRFNHILLPRSTSLLHRKPVDDGIATSRFTYAPNESYLQRPVVSEGMFGSWCGWSAR